MHTMRVVTAEEMSGMMHIFVNIVPTHAPEEHSHNQTHEYTHAHVRTQGKKEMNKSVGTPFALPLSCKKIFGLCELECTLPYVLH